MADAPRPREGTVEVDGLRLHYLDWSRHAAGAVPALAFHGFALNAHSFDEVAPRLAGRLDLLAFDQRGHGLSDRAPDIGDYTRDRMAEDIAEIVERLGLDRPVVMGHSMGGLNALTFAARHPSQLRALILIDVGPRVAVDGAEQVRRFVAGPYEMESLDEWVEHTHAYYPWRSKERIRARLEVSLRRTPEGRLAKQFDPRFRAAEFAGVAGGREDPAELARRLRCPTLLVRGGESPVLPREAAEAFAKEVPVVRLVAIDGAGHSVAGDRPEAFARAVHAFLDELEGER